MDVPKGKCVSLDLSNGSRVKGFVHTIDKKAGIICLEEVPSSNFILVAIKNVKKHSVIQDPGVKRIWPDKVSVDHARMKVEEERVLKSRHAQYCQIGVGVSPEGQATFNALAKTLPCQWQGTTIVVFDNVRISPPYTVNSISEDGDAAAKAHVKIVLENEREKIAASSKANGEQK